MPEPSVCAITGTIYTTAGDGKPNVFVASCVLSSDELISKNPIFTYTDDDGEFILSLPYAAVALVTIPELGINAYFTVPSEATANFADLTLTDYR